MACLEETFHPRQHHALAVAAEIARAQSGREHLAIHARQLALEPRLQILRRHPRPLLLRLEQAHRHALENHVHRDQRLGLPVMIIKSWYKGAGSGGSERPEPQLRKALFERGPPLDPAGAIAERLAAPGVLRHPLGTPADGTARL